VTRVARCTTQANAPTLDVRIKGIGEVGEWLKPAVLKTVRPQKGLVGSNPTLSASQSGDFSLPVHFDEIYRFCGPRRANNAWGCNVYFSGRRETATIGPYFSGAPQAVPFQADPMSRCRDSVAVFGFTTT
jgi:hypothetical protein